MHKTYTKSQAMFKGMKIEKIKEIEIWLKIDFKILNLINNDNNKHNLYKMRIPQFSFVLISFNLSSSSFFEVRSTDNSRNSFSLKENER